MMSKSYDSTADTEDHINQVSDMMDIIFHEISKRVRKHDASKLCDPEKETFDRVTPLLAGSTYGSDEYKEALASMKPALDHHYKHNSHHPEHFKDGMKGMNLVDMIEMFCDWCAATYRHDDGNIGKSIDINMKRFGYDETLASIFVNTVQQYNMGQRSCVAFRKEIE